MPLARMKALNKSTKFEFVLDLKTAKTLDIEAPCSMLSTADKVIDQEACL